MPGMLTTILKNLFSRPVTRLYPVQPRQPSPSARGRLILDMSKCTLCTACEKRCPAGAIEIKRQEGYYKYDPFSCIVCGACVEACPMRCLEVDSTWLKPTEKMETRVWHIEPKTKTARSS